MRRFKMRKNTFIYLLILIQGLFLLSACGKPDIGVNVGGGVLDVSVASTPDGIFITDINTTIPFIKTGIFDAGWKFGLPVPKSFQAKGPYYLYVIYEDNQGRNCRDEYNIGNKFEITAQEGEKIQKIESLPNGTIFIYIETQYPIEISCDDIWRNAPYQYHPFSMKDHVMQIADNSMGKKILGFLPGQIIGVILYILLIPLILLECILWVIVGIGINIPDPHLQNYYYLAIISMLIVFTIKRFLASK